jgi:hypothetical protein
MKANSGLRPLAAVCFSGQRSVMLGRFFTLVCEFRGGTYISQVRASDERDAVRAWTEMLVRERPIKRVSVYIAKSVATWFNDPPVPLEGLSGAWCFSGICGGDSFLVNIIETAIPVNGS